MKYLKKTLILGVFFASCKPTAIAIIKPLRKDSIEGNVKFVEERNGMVYMVANLVEKKNNPGNLDLEVRSIHIHERGDCSAIDGSSAGKIWTPKESPKKKKDFHKESKNKLLYGGKIGNVRFDSKGKAFYGMITDSWCIGCKDSNKNILGKSVVVHKKMSKKPNEANNSNKKTVEERIGCGIIRLK